MSKYLILSDCHNSSWILDQIVSWESDADKFIFLGDFFDSWSDSPELNGRTAAWLKQALENPKNIICVGNHDWSYMWPMNDGARCSGFTHEKCREIYKNITKEDLLKLKLAYFDDENEIIFSHAGFDRYLFPVMSAKGFETPNLVSYNSIKAWTQHMTPIIYDIYNKGGYHPLMGAGYDRGGTAQKIGGSIWADFGSHLPISGLRQIFGHSVRQEPRFQFINKDKTPQHRVINGYTTIKDEWFKETFSCDLDTGLKHYMVIDDGIMIIYEIIHKRDTVSGVTESVSRGKEMMRVNIKNS